MGTIDYRHLANLDSWDRKKAALIIDGQDPSDPKHRDFAPGRAKVPPGYENAAKVYEMLAATDWRGRYGADDKFISERPAFIVRTAIDAGFVVPQRLRDEMRARRQRDDARQRDLSRAAQRFSAIERQNMLKIIIAFAIDGYGMDPDAPRNMKAKQMAKGLEKAGVPLDEDTLKKYLDEAKALRAQIVQQQIEPF